MAKRQHYPQRGPKQTPKLRYRRGHVLDRHAINRDGQPVMCPLNTDPTKGHKVAYPSREAAVAAAGELRQLRARLLKPYRCPRDHNHWHLSTDLNAMRRDDQAS